MATLSFSAWHKPWREELTEKANPGARAGAPWYHRAISSAGKATVLC